MKTINKEMSEPKLAKPGAGVPFLQRMVLRWYIGPRKAGRADWDFMDVAFQKVNAKILKVIEGRSSEELERRVLIPPQKGLEDSSRYWSVAMALEHLTLVGRHMVSIVIDLSRGRVPSLIVSTAAVKPKGGLGAVESVRAFREFSETAVAELNAKVGDRESSAKLRHPWFGPFIAKQWHWLLTGHTHVHYGQIKAILKGLEGSVSSISTVPHRK